MINLRVPEVENHLRPKLIVVGVGGAGNNAVNNMIDKGLEGVEFCSMNTDAQALAHNKAAKKIQLGLNITQGLGAGSKPQIGQAAAEEAAEDIAEVLAGCNMVFIAAGMGGGTGSGAAPVVARIAKEHDILTVGVVTKPFHFEGSRRMKVAEAAIEELQRHVDTLIVIPNQNLFRIATDRTTFAEAFTMADDVLNSGVRGVTDLIVMPGTINLDFADIRTVMGEMGKAMMGTGEAEGEGRALRAAELAISNPLLDEVSIEGARAMLVNITGGMDLALHELDEAMHHIRGKADPEANIIFGSAIDTDMQGKLRISVIATGMDMAAQTGITGRGNGSMLPPPAPYGVQGGGQGNSGNFQSQQNSNNTPTNHVVTQAANNPFIQARQTMETGLSSRPVAQNSVQQHMANPVYQGMQQQNANPQGAGNSANSPRPSYAVNPAYSARTTPSAAPKAYEGNQTASEPRNSDNTSGFNGNGYSAQNYAATQQASSPVVAVSAPNTNTPSVQIQTDTVQPQAAASLHRPQQVAQQQDILHTQTIQRPNGDVTRKAASFFDRMTGSHKSHDDGYLVDSNVGEQQNNQAAANAPTQGNGDDLTANPDHKVTVSSGIAGSNRSPLEEKLEIPAFLRRQS